MPGDTVKVLALKSFENLIEGDTVVVELTERWAHLIVIHYVKLVDRWPQADTQSE